MHITFGLENVSMFYSVAFSRSAETLAGDSSRGPFSPITITLFQRSYFARLNYVHQNAVKHGLVPVANQYPWCSAAWFERSASPAIIESIYRFKVDQVQVYDPFKPVME